MYKSDLMTRTAPKEEPVIEGEKKEFSLPADADEFRNYSNSPYHARVQKHYRLMREHQTVDFVRRMHAKYSFAEGACRARFTVREAFDKLADYVDCSDPDLGLPNALHAFQTAEGARRAGQPDWFQLTCLLHDFGKIMFLWGRPEDGQDGTASGDQWALGGDTWVVGCAIPGGVVFPEYNALNPDMADGRYNTAQGMYREGCGLDGVLFAWGHDEYMYQMLKANRTALPDDAARIIRYHSAYPWHSKGEYRHLMAPQDFKTLEWVNLFNQFDLYTKDEEFTPNVEELWPYYQSLVDKYMPGDLRW
ncbi:unnamed protein product [Phaeothamnion confervicola]